MSVAGCAGTSSGRAGVHAAAAAVTRAALHRPLSRPFAPVTTPCRLRPLHPASGDAHAGLGGPGPCVAPLAGCSPSVSWEAGRTQQKGLGLPTWRQSGSPRPGRMPPKPLGHRRPWLPPAPSPAPCLSAITRTSNPLSVPHTGSLAPTPRQDPRTSLPALALEMPAGHPENQENALAHRPGPPNLPPCRELAPRPGTTPPRLFGVGGHPPSAPPGTSRLGAQAQRQQMSGDCGDKIVWSVSRTEGSSRGWNSGVGRGLGPR